MIVHLATSRGKRAITKHLWYRPALNRRVAAVGYESLLSNGVWPRGVYLFTDSERMTSAQMRYAERLWECMALTPGAFVVLNHPSRHLPRYSLLKKLFDTGFNDFNVHRVHEIDECVRYPVFLRYENRHIGSLTPLLRTRDEAEDWIARLAADGEQLEHVIATEFVETVDHERLYRKYGAFRIGGRIVPRHMFVGTHWEVKVATNTKAAFRRREEYGYLRSNPHADALMEVFEIAGLQYGRIDYALKNGRIQVWEINDNPQVSSSLARHWKGRLGRNLDSLRRMDAAFAVLEAQIAPGPPVAIDVSAEPEREAVCVP